MNDESYRQWLQGRRDERCPKELASEVMASVSETDVQHRGSLVVLLLARIERSRVTRFAACCGALVVGSTPFVYFAYVAKFFEN